MSQAIQTFTPLPPAYQGSPQQQVSAALASSSSGMQGDSIAPVAIGATAGGLLLTAVVATLAVKHFSTSGDKPKPVQTTSPTSKPVKRADAPQLEKTLAQREIHYYPQLHYTVFHEKYKEKYMPEVAFLQRSILDDLSSRKIEDVFSESLREINHGKRQEYYRKGAESAFKEYEPGQNLTEPQKFALGRDGAAAIYPYMPTTTWAVTTHPTESALLFEETEAAHNRYFNGMDRRINGLRDGTNNGPSEQDIDRWKSEYEKLVFDAREESCANHIRDFFKNNPTKKRASAIMGSDHVKLPDLIEKKIPNAKVIRHDFLPLSSFR
jgi:hypothetical protein